MPAITSGSASVCPRTRAERSTRAASVAGRAACTRCTSSHPGARLVSMSPSAAIRRCSALRRSIAAPSGDSLLEDAIALESAPFLERESEDLAEYVVVVRADGGSGAHLKTRRRREAERRCHDVHLADRRVLGDRPHPAVRELRVREQLRDREHRRGPEPPAAQDPHDLVAVPRRCPGLYPLVQLRMRRTAFRGRRRAADPGDAANRGPLL